jgi:DNA-binding response OmpR family regulator
MAHEIFQEPEFTRLKIDPLIGACGGPRQQIKFEIADLKPGTHRGRAAPAHQCIDPRQQLDEGIRFGQIVITARLQVGDLELDLLTRAANRGATPIDLQPREFRLLEYLMRHAGQVVTRTMLLESVWEYHFDPQTNVIDVHISRLRAKIDKGFETPLLHTVRGAGYMIRARN